MSAGPDLLFTACHELAHAQGGRGGRPPPRMVGAARRRRRCAAARPWRSSTSSGPYARRTRLACAHGALTGWSRPRLPVRVLGPRAIARRSRAASANDASAVGGRPAPSYGRMVDLLVAGGGGPGGLRRQTSDAGPERLSPCRPPSSPSWSPPRSPPRPGRCPGQGKAISQAPVMARMQPEGSVEASPPSDARQPGDPSASTSSGASTWRDLPLSLGVTDIRSHMGWLEDDRDQDRRGPGRHVPKHEGRTAEDGTPQTERVTRLVDWTGTASLTRRRRSRTTSRTTAGIGAVLLAAILAGDELWFTCIPTLAACSTRTATSRSASTAQHGYGLRSRCSGTTCTNS